MCSAGPGKAHHLEAPGTVKDRGETKAVAESNVRPSQILILCPHSWAATSAGEGLILWCKWTRKAQKLGTPGTKEEGRIWWRWRVIQATCWMQHLSPQASSPSLSGPLHPNLQPLGRRPRWGLGIPRLGCGEGHIKVNLLPSLPRMKYACWQRLVCVYRASNQLLSGQKDA